jgi:hypothetical protein
VVSCSVISPGNAVRHIENIYGRIGVRNRAQVSLFAVKYGLVRAEPDPESNSAESGDSHSIICPE